MFIKLKFKLKNKLNEIDPDGTKPVFVVGHLSAIYYYNDGELVETLINGTRSLFYDIFKGHKNAFYLYGHVHGERSCYKKFSSGAILHINKENLPVDMNLTATDSKDKDLAQLVQVILQREAVGAHLAGQVDGLLLVKAFLGLVDQGQHVAHAQYAAGHAVGVEGLDVRQLFADARELDGLARH